MNIGRIFIQQQIDEANNLSLFTKIEKNNNCFSIIYTLEGISTTLDLSICRSKPFRADFMPAILLCLGHTLLTPWGVNNAQLFRDSKSMLDCLKQ